jgi:major vault protein
MVALHLKAIKNFRDIYGKERKAGDEWIIHKGITDMHILDAYEELIQQIMITVLSVNQYCIVENPVDNKTGEQKYGIRVLYKGETKFFLQPGEEIVGGIKKMLILQEDEAVLLKAREKFHCEHTKKTYGPGETWMIRGPIELTPAIEYDVIENRKAIPLSENEGVYVRDLKTGEVSLVRGPKTFLLGENQSFWEKRMEPEVERLLSTTGYIPLTEDARGTRGQYVVAPIKKERDFTKAVTYKAPHNAAVQLFDYK